MTPAPRVRPAALPGAEDEIRLEIGGDAVEERPFLAALSGMRFFPAVMVLMGHVLICWRATYGLSPVATDFTRWCAAGAAMLSDHPIVLSVLMTAGAALGCFFQLSGFVLAYVYLVESRAAALDRRSFWAARFARVYPTYALGLAAGLYLFLVETRDAGPASLAPEWSVAGVGTTVVSNLLLLQAWWPTGALAWNAPGWSLSCEAFFYLAFPLLVRAVDRCRPRTLVAVVVLCWLAAMAPPAAYLWLRPDGLEQVTWTSDAYWLRVVRYNPLFRLPEFVSGLALGKLFLAVGGRPEVRRRGAWLSCGGTAVGLAGVVLHHPIGVPFALVFNGFFDLVCGVVIFGLALGGGPVHRLLAWRPIALLGDASFALYILHVPLIAYALRLLAPFGDPGFHPAVFVAFILCLAAVGSVLVHQEYEVPMRRLVRRLLLEPFARTPPAVS
jgi:peptidoglycan/LPS O-acetylase OafA/YrhL